MNERRRVGKRSLLCLSSFCYSFCSSLVELWSRHGHKGTAGSLCLVSKKTLIHLVTLFNTKAIISANFDLAGLSAILFFFQQLFDDRLTRPLKISVKGRISVTVTARSLGEDFTLKIKALKGIGKAFLGGKLHHFS